MKFKYGDKVRVKNSFYAGLIGNVYSFSVAFGSGKIQYTIEHDTQNITIDIYEDNLELIKARNLDKGDGMVRINRTYSVAVEDIQLIRETNRNVRVYLKSGYPSVLITDCTKEMLLLRMVNSGVSSKRIEELK